MKIGDLFIELGVQGDTKKLDEAIKKLQAVQAKEKMRLQFREKIIKLNKLISEAATSEQKQQLINLKNAEKENYVNKFKLRSLEEQKKLLGEQNTSWRGMVKGVAGFVAGISAAIIAMDRLGNKVLQTNQLYTNFTKQTGISINSLNRMAGVAKLSGMNLPVEQVAGDLNSLQQKIYKLGLTGEGAGIFAMLGMNPMGMDSGQFINALRGRFKGLNGVQKSYVLDQLGLSREWLNVLELSDAQYIDFVKQSRKLQLTEEERKELAKQKIAIALLPIVTKIMECASKVAVSISDAFGNDKFIHVVRDIALWLGIAAVKAGMIQKALSFSWLTSLFKGGKGGLLGLFGLGAAGKPFIKGAAAKAGAGIGARLLGGAAGGPIGWILLAWTLVDIFNLLKQWFTKDTESDNNEPPIDIPAWDYQQNVNSSMVNHFYNNPVPQQEVVNELNLIYMNYLDRAKK